MKKITAHLCGILLVGASGCSGAPDATSDNTEAESIGDLAQDLWLKTFVTKWPNGDMPVCFGPCVGSGCTDFTPAEKTTIRNLIMTSWGDRVNVSPLTNFTGWGTCPNPIPGGRSVFRINSNLAGAGLFGQSVDANGNGRWGYAGSSPGFLEIAGHPPDPKTVIHEFGHALGFIHEHKENGTCDQRTSDGVQLTGWDEPNSVMSTTPCNGGSPVLSPNDKLGIKLAYARDTDGSGTIHTYNDDIYNADGRADTSSGNLVKCRGRNEVLVGIDQWSWPDAHTIQCRAMAGTWVSDIAGRKYAYNDTGFINNGVMSCGRGFVAIGYDFALNLLYCSESTAYQGNPYLSNLNANNIGHFNYTVQLISSEIHQCPTGAIQGGNIAFDKPRAGQGYNFSCINP